MATEVISTIRSSGGDYTSLSAWEAGEQGDLVTADEIRTAECYDDWPSGLSNNVTIDGSTTDSTRYLRLTVASGHRHNGTPQSGFWLLSNASRTIDIADQYTRLEWIDAEATLSTGHAIGVSTGGDNALLDRCIAKGGASNGAGLRTLQIGAVARNCLAWGGGGSGIQTSGTCTVDNCLATNCGTGFTSVSSAVIRNCVAYNNTTNYSGTVNASSTHNATSSATDNAPGGSSVINVASTDFVNAAANDYHLASGSVLIGAGANLTSDFTTDIDGDTRPSSGAWDIGFDHRVAGGTTHAAALTESASATDAAIASYLAAASSSEAASASDVVAALLDAVAALSEPASTSDVVATDGGQSGVVSEPVSAADLVAAVKLAVAAVAEAASATDQQTTGPVTSASLAESATAVDAIAAAALLVGALAENVNASDAVTRAAQLVVLLTEPASATDTVAANSPTVHNVSVAELAAALDLIAAVLSGTVVLSASPLGQQLSAAVRRVNAGGMRRPNTTTRTR